MGMYSIIIKENDILEESNVFDILDESQEIHAYIEQEYLSLCEEQGLEELMYFEQNRKEIPFNESDVSLGKKIVNLINNIWAFIQRYINKFIVYLDNFNKTNRKFVYDHREEINNIDLKNFSYKGYNYTLSNHIDEFGFINKISMMAYIGNTDDINSYKSKLYGKILNKNISYSDKEFKSELFKVFRGGQDQKVDIKIDKTKIMEETANEKYNKNMVTTLHNKCKDAINKAIKDLEGEINEYKSKEYDPYLHRISIQIYKMSFSVLNTYIKDYMKAINEYNHQNKDILIKMLEYNRMNKQK